MSAPGGSDARSPRVAGAVGAVSAASASGLGAGGVVGRTAEGSGRAATRRSGGSGGSVGEAAAERVLAALDRGPLGVTPIDRLGDSELRFLAMALVLLTGPGVLAMDQASEVPPALRAMTVVADGLDSGLDRAQTGALLSLAVRAAQHGHVRVVGTAHDAESVRAEGVMVIPLGERERRRAREGGMPDPGSSGEAGMTDGREG